MLACNHMCQSGTPLFIIYSYSSVIILSLITAFSILYMDPKHPSNRNAFYFILAIALWTIGDLIQWEATVPIIGYIFNRLSYLADFFFLFFLYFAYYFVGEDLTAEKRIILALPLSLTAIAVIGGFGVGTFEKDTCGYDVDWYIFPSLFLNLAYSVWASFVLLKKYRCPSVHYNMKSQIRVLVFAIMFFVLWSLAYEAVDVFSVMEEVGIEISPYFILGNLFFISLIAFAIIEYDLFDFGLIPRKWFAFAILSAIFGGMFFLSLTPMFYLFLLLFYIGTIWVFWGK
jgi:hypothetical protein